MKTVYVSKTSEEEIKKLQDQGYRVINLDAPQDEGGPMVSPLVAMGLLLMLLAGSILFIAMLALAIAQDPEILILLLPIVALSYFFLGRGDD